MIEIGTGGTLAPARTARVSELALWSTWRLVRAGPFRFFSARMGEAGQGYPHLSITETNWRGGPLPTLFRPAIDFPNGPGGVPPSFEAVRLFLSGTWTSDLGTAPAAAIGGWWTSISGFPTLEQPFVTSNPSTWELDCPVDPIRPLVVRFCAFYAPTDDP